MNRVIYIGRYTLPSDYKHKVFLACNNKMSYIINCINEIGYGVDILSTATYKDKYLFMGSEKHFLGDNTLNFAPSIVNNNYLFRLIQKLILWLWILKSLVFHSSSQVIIYHDLESIKPMNLIMKILKKHKYILEVEEIYSLIQDNLYNKKSELKYIRSFSSLTYVSDSIKGYIGKDGVVIYGNYKYAQIKAEHKTDRHHIILVFTGTIDHIRGSFEAIETMQYLPDNYLLYISGKGDEKMVDELKEKIVEINNKRKSPVCKYLGVLSNEGYSSLLNKCDIAINSQIDGVYSKYLFPSKLINYLAKEIVVVTTPGISILNSPFKDMLYITDDYTPQSLANTILKIDVFFNRTYDRFLDLHKRLCYNLKKEYFN